MLEKNFLKRREEREEERRNRKEGERNERMAKLKFLVCSLETSSLPKRGG